MLSGKESVCSVLVARYIEVPHTAVSYLGSSMKRRNSEWVLFREIKSILELDRRRGRSKIER